MTTTVINKEENNLIVPKDVQLKLINLEKTIKELKAQDEEIKKTILQGMIDNGIKQFKSDDLTITLIESQEREYFDQKAFRTDNPDLYDGYVSFRKQAPSIRIKLG